MPGTRSAFDTPQNPLAQSNGRQPTAGLKHAESQHAGWQQGFAVGFLAEDSEKATYVPSRTTSKVITKRYFIIGISHFSVLKHIDYAWL